LEVVDAKVQEKQRSTDQHHVPEKQMIFRLVFAISRFCVGRKLVLGTERSLVTGIAGGVIAAGILSTLLIFDLRWQRCCSKYYKLWEDMGLLWLNGDVYK
jgi:hypothetical protein